MRLINKDELIEKCQCLRGIYNNCDKCISSVNGAYYGKCIEQNINSLPEINTEIQLPVLKTWTLKKEHVDFLKYLGICSAYERNTEPIQKQYYDCVETIDYSKLTKGSVVELKGASGATTIRVVESVVLDTLNYKDGARLYSCVLSDIVRVIELGKEDK